MLQLSYKVRAPDNHDFVERNRSVIVVSTLLRNLINIWCSIETREV